MKAQSWYSQTGQVPISARKKATLMRRKKPSKTPLTMSWCPTLT